MTPIEIKLELPNALVRSFDVPVRIERTAVPRFCKALSSVMQAVGGCSAYHPSYRDDACWCHYSWVLAVQGTDEQMLEQFTIECSSHAPPRAGEPQAQDVAPPPSAEFAHRLHPNVNCSNHHLAQNRCRAC